MSRFGFFDLFKSLLPQPNVKSKDIATPGPLVDPQEVEDAIGSIWVDLTKKRRTKKRGKARGQRPWSNITGITLHQTAVDFGPNPMRLLNVPAHGATLKDGKIVLIHDPTDYMWHGHKFNKHDIGIEISCRAAGILGNGRTFWRSKKEREAGKKYTNLVSESSDVQLEATKELCRYYIELVKENGGEIKFIHAHRQAHKSRVSDPGSRIWKAIAIPLMTEFGLSCGPIGWAAGSGHPIPEAWDLENGNGVRYSGSVRGFKTIIDQAEETISKQKR